MKILNRFINLFYDPVPLLRQLDTLNDNLFKENYKLNEIKSIQASVITDLRQRHAKLTEENTKLMVADKEGNNILLRNIKDLQLELSIIKKYLKTKKLTRLYIEFKKQANRKIKNNRL